MKHVHSLALALSIGVLFAAGVTFAAWQGTTWIASGTVIDANKIKDNFDYLYSQVGSSVSQWVTSGANIYYSTGNVGIGTASPDQKLQVVGTVYSTSGGFKFPDGTLQSTAATKGSITCTTRSATTTQEFASNNLFSVSCQSGETLTGGGFKQLGSNVYCGASYPSGNSWVIDDCFPDSSFYNANYNGVTVYAQCCKVQ